MRGTVLSLETNADSVNVITEMLFRKSTLPLAVCQRHHRQNLQESKRCLGPFYRQEKHW